MTHLTTLNWDRQATEATSLPSEYPISSSKINASQFSEWAQESFQISETLVYQSLVDG